MIYNCTKDFLNAIKAEPTKRPDIYSNLFSWNVKLAKVGRKTLVYLMNDASKLSVIFYGVTAKEYKAFDQMVKAAIQDVLIDCGVTKEIINAFIHDCGEPIFTTSGTKKQLGTLNRAAMDVQYLFEKFMDNQILQRRLCHHQNESIVKNDNDNYVRPAQTMRNMLWKAYSGCQITYDFRAIAREMFNDENLDIIPFLNISNGNISHAKRNSFEYESLKNSNANVCIGHESFDFFRMFHTFAAQINNPSFHMKLDRLGHGIGANKRILDLLDEYPSIEKQWIEYKAEQERSKVNELLETFGLL